MIPEAEYKPNRIELPVTYEAENDQQARPSDRVLIRELPVKSYTTASAVFADEPRFIELVCVKPQGWAESLTPESYARVAIACKEANARFFASLARRVETLRAVAPGVELVKSA